MQAEDKFFTDDSHTDWHRDYCSDNCYPSGNVQNISKRNDITCLLRRHIIVSVNAGFLHQDWRLLFLEFSRNIAAEGLVGVKSDGGIQDTLIDHNAGLFKISFNPHVFDFKPYAWEFVDKSFESTGFLVMRVFEQHVNSGRFAASNRNELECNFRLTLRVILIQPRNRLELSSIFIFFTLLFLRRFFGWIGRNRLFGLFNANRVLKIVVCSARTAFVCRSFAIHAVFYTQVMKQM